MMNTQIKTSEAKTLYPHTPQVVRLNPFSGTGALAGVTLRYGPVFIRAYIRQTNEGKLFLSMPGRKNEKGDWWDSAYFVDRSISEEFQALAVETYQTQLGLAALPLAEAA
ncbi:hypothetical protein JST97_22330 [bacterium]|nr:hypothetical protein [bacterium]